MPGIKCVIKCPYTEIIPKVLQLSACWAETNKQQMQLSPTAKCEIGTPVHCVHHAFLLPSVKWAHM